MFQEVKQKVQAQFKKLSASPLFKIEVDRDKIWEIYLAAFTEDKRQENNCNCCKSFLRQFSGIVGIEDGKIITLWDFDVEDEEYKEPIKAIGKYIRGLPITGIFLNDFKNCGTDKNLDQKRSIPWEHFYLELPSAVVKKDSGPDCATALDNKSVLKRSLEEITDDAVDTVLELIGQNSLYRGNEFAPLVKELQKVKIKYKSVKGQTPKDNFCWLESKKISAATCRIKNSAIGTLLNSLSEGMELDKAVSAFEKVVAPTNYKRPTSLVTPRMIEDAKKRLQELNLVEALNRRLLTNKDLNVENSLFVHRATKRGGDIFDQLKQESSINPKSLSKVEEISAKDFFDKVIPTAKSIRVLLENQHLGNFVSLVGPQEEGETLFKWGNNYSWNYSGEVADSIKERVKAAGGNVDGRVRISLSWDNTDDLDLHLIEPDGHHVYYAGRSGKSGCKLDIDANGQDGFREDPVENIYWPNLPTKEGIYRVVVNNYNKRSSQNVGYTLEFDIDGETHHWSFNNNSAPNKEIFQFKYSKKDGISIISGQTNTTGTAKYNSKEKWGIKTGNFHKVNAITLSPNYWNNSIGNKHFFFFLENCVADEKIRPFYNEFLKPALDKDRKVFELLASKVEIEKPEGELSGIGFSDTVRSELIVEIEGAFKRLVKIKF